MLSKLAGIFLLLSFVLAKGVDLIIDTDLPAYTYQLEQHSDEVPDDDSKENKLTEFADEFVADGDPAGLPLVLSAKFNTLDIPDTRTVYIALSCPPPDLLTLC
jgi:hypothetical protein